MPSDHVPVGAQPTILPRSRSIVTTRLRPCSVTNAHRLSGEMVTPSGDGEPGTSGCRDETVARHVDLESLAPSSRRRRSESSPSPDR